MANWKIKPDLSAGNGIEYIPFLSSRKFFAVDDSGSTAGAILRRERAFVDGLREKDYANKADQISLWGTRCDAPTKKFETICWTSDHCGTRPEEILKNPTALTTITKSDVWFLVTDGQIYNAGVHELAQLAHDHSVLSVPVVFVIVGSRGRTPESTDISVGISFFASSQDTLILFKETETGKIYVIASKGCFARIGGSVAAQDLTSWSALPMFDDESTLFKHCEKLDIKVVEAESRSTFPKGVSLGSEWESAHGGPVWIDLDLLLQAGRLEDDEISDLLAEEAFNVLAVAYKTRRRIPELRAFVQEQKIEQVTPKLQDVSGAAIIISKMSDPTTTEEERKKLQERLREAHAKNRENYQKTIMEFVGSPKEKSIKKRNQLVDAALRALASIEAASFNAEILSRRSNRARRAEVVSSDNTVEMANLDLEGPSCKGFCLVCCGEEEIMSICLKELDSERVDDNTTDFALNFPLAAGASTKNADMVSSQNVCFQCALLGPSGMSIYKEKLKAIIPTVHYEGNNKKYINDQLYLALTAGLATGAAGIAQLFIAILDEVLQRKSWAGAGLQDSQLSAGENHEAVQRRKTFGWMLDQLVGNTHTRQNFTETGEWVKFPEALAWAATDFEENGLASFTVTYPIAGFGKLLRLGQKTASFNEDILRRLRIAKAVYSIAAKYLADMQTANQNATSDDQWKQKYLEPLYQDFNATLVPRDRGTASIVTDVQVFMERLSGCFGQAESVEFELATNEDRRAIMRKTQVILFWLIYQQKSLCRAQTFFTNISNHHHLATAVLDPSLNVPESELRALLLSIFAREDAQLIDPDAAASHCALVPFKNPFGPSVLHCGICNEPFGTINSQAIKPSQIEDIRRSRGQHMIKIFGIQGRFETSDTGLPERFGAGKPPSSIHSNLHVSVARTWAEQSREKRRAIIDNETDRATFIADVRKRICEQGRGDVFSKDIDAEVGAVLPSFFNVLGQALRIQDKSDEDITLYEHDFEKNTVEDKIRYEIQTMELR